MSWDYEKIMRQLQDSMTVVVGIEARHSAALQDHDQWLESLQKGVESLQKGVASLQTGQEALRESVASLQQWMESLERSYELHEQRMHHIDVRLAEITEKLDALIQITDDHSRDGHRHGGPPPPQ